MLAIFNLVHLLSLVSALAFFLPAAAISARTSKPKGQFLEATTIVTNSQGHSAFECWRLTDAFTTSADAGTAGAATMNIEDLANATYTVLPPRFQGGVHNAPHPQYASVYS